MTPTLASLLFLTALPAAALLTHPSSPASPILQDPISAMPKQKITTCLWFTDNAEEAMRFYVATFKGAKVVDESRWGEGGMMPKGTLMAAHFQVDGQQIMVLNHNPARNFTDAMSLSVSCETQAEIDELWKKLIAGGGEPGRCGWCKDKFGVSWQIVPSVLGELMGDKDPARAQRVGAALMQMDKLDIARLKKAADQR
jgi:predicted 3-demethylubiquinone-9 3-methyltransferase (glyoxalase superfamily)